MTDHTASENEEEPESQETLLIEVEKDGSENTSVEETGEKPPFWIDAALL